MLKLAAAILVISGTTGLGIYYCREMKNRIWHLQYIVQMLSMMESEIVYSKVTFAEACSTVSRRVKEPYQGFLRSVYERVQAFSGEGLLPIWCGELAKIEKELPLKQEEMTLLEGVVEEQGFIDGEMQIKKMTFQMEQVQDKIQMLKSKEENKSRIYLYLGIMSGILCTIVFL